MKFLIDNQLPTALARFIDDELGAEAVHVLDLNMDRCADTEIWLYASKHGFIVISKDEDFFQPFCRRITC